MTRTGAIHGFAGSGWDEEKLIAECLAGNDLAWSAFLQRYQSLIYSIALRFGLSRDDAGDVFQQVCLQVLNALPELREPKTLTAWIITIASRATSRHISRDQGLRELSEEEIERVHSGTDRLPEAVLRDLQQEQILRGTILELSARCRELIQMLFYKEPASTYDEAAARLGLPRGSVGFMRTGCLKRLRSLLEERHFL